MKEKVTTSRVRTPPPEVPNTSLENSPQSAMVPHCAACQHKIDLLEEALMVLPGQWMPNREVGEPLFTLDVDVPLKFAQLPNGQYALLTEDGSSTIGLVRHIHADCLDRMIAEAHGEMDLYMDEEMHREYRR